MPDVENFRFFHICHGKAFEISPHVEKMLISRPMVKYAYLRASNARASFVNVPEKISGKNAHLARARVMGKWRADLWDQFFCGKWHARVICQSPRKNLGKERILDAHQNFQNFQFFSNFSILEFLNFQSQPARALSTLGLLSNCCNLWEDL